MAVCCLVMTAFPIASEDEYLKNVRWYNYVRKINTEIREFSGIVGVVVKDLNTGATYAYNADRDFISASLIKLPIMVAIFKEFIDGNISFTEEYPLDDSCRVSGSGILKHKPNGSTYTVYELVYTMIAESDNTAARILTECIGYKRMNELFKSLGLKNTNISPQSFNLATGEITGESFTTPRDMACLLEKIYDKQLFRRYLSEQMIDILKLTIDRQRLNKYLPRTFELAHKTGLLRGACHDAGIVFSPHGDYLICILTNANGHYQQAKHFIASLGKLTFDQLKRS